MLNNNGRFLNNVTCERGLTWYLSEPCTFSRKFLAVETHSQEEMCFFVKFEYFLRFTGLSVFCQIQIYVPPLFHFLPNFNSKPVSKRYSRSTYLLYTSRSHMCNKKLHNGYRIKGSSGVVELYKYLEFNRLIYFVFEYKHKHFDNSFLFTVIFPLRRSFVLVETSDL